MPNSAQSFVAGAETVVDFSRDIWSVSRLNAEARAVLGDSFPLLWVQGELSNLSQPTSGHLYFTLKDEAAQVRCAMFRFKRRLLQFKPGNGEQVLIRARVGLYEPRGDYQLVAEHMEPAGEGALRVELERVKRRLAAEGLFDEARKQPLPAFPRQVGLITSASAAALQDLLTVLGRRLPLLPVLVYPAQVQGSAAVADLVAALELANRRTDCDLLFVGRGGGSFEDLMVFNDEALLRAIVASKIPVITGIGHEVDISLADLVADRRAPTPSAAAELVTPSTPDLLKQIQALERRLVAAQAARLAKASQRIEAALRHLRLLDPVSRLLQQAQAIDRSEHRLAVAMQYRLERSFARSRALAGRLIAGSPASMIRAASKAAGQSRQRLLAARFRALDSRRERLAAAAGRLDALSPLATLARGYAIVSLSTEATPIRDARQVPVGSRILVRPETGRLIATVEQTGN